MRLFVVRHGQTDYNRDSLIMGTSIDAPLNKTGIQQTKSLIPELKKHDFEMLYSSPMLRTRQTAEILNTELGLTVEIRDELTERDVGDLAGKSYTEVSKIIGEDSYNGAKYDYRPYGGESADEVSARIKKFVDYVMERHASHNDTGKELLVVTHGGIIRLLYKHFEQPVEHDIHNVCVHEF